MITLRTSRRPRFNTLLVAMCAALGACGDEHSSSHDARDAEADVGLDADTIPVEVSGDTADVPEVDHDIDPGVDETSELDSRPDETAVEDSGALLDVDDTSAIDASDIADTSEPPKPGAPAMPCDVARPCATDLVCVTLDATHTIGFCAPTCTTLHATCGYFGPGVYAECVVTLPDETLACAFICEQLHGDHSHTHTCPSGDWGRLRCERSTGAFGHNYCAPRQD